MQLESLAVRDVPLCREAVVVPPRVEDLQGDQALRVAADVEAAGAAGHLAPLAMAGVCSYGVRGVAGCGHLLCGSCLHSHLSAAPLQNGGKVLQTSGQLLRRDALLARAQQRGELRGEVRHVSAAEGLLLLIRRTGVDVLQYARMRPCC
jgi:hypothetical protein